MTASDDDRIAYLAGDPVESLTAAERAELDHVRALLEAEDTWAEPPAELEDRVVAAIAAAAEASPAAAADTAPAIADGPAPAAAPVTPLAKPTRATKEPRQRSWTAKFMERPAYAFAFMGVLVAVIAAITAITTSGSNKASLPQQPQQPQQFAMVVNGTGLAPGAHGSATLTKMSSGWQVRLSATGLPRLSNGRYYQAWLKNSAGLLVPIGTFNDAVNVTLWSGVPVTQFRTLTVTRQQANGNPVSSGQRVLIGTIRSGG